MSNYLERIGQDKIEDREEIEQLTARVRELEEELERKMSAGQYVLEQLAASQAYAEQLREALETLNKVSNIGCDRVEKAIALPRDTSVLDAFVAESREAAYQEARKAADQLEKGLARQRDLAVEALKHVRNVLPNALWADDSKRMIDATIKESEAMAEATKKGC